MSDLTQSIAELPLEERIRLEERLLAARKGGQRAQIPRRGSDDPAPLSFEQERLWVLDRLYPGRATYNEADAYRLRGQLNIRALQAALDGAVQRHEILRSTYHSRDQGPVQVVEKPRQVTMPVSDLTGVAESERVVAAQRSFAAVIETPFDLTGDLMLRACLYRLGVEDHILLIVRHHIAFDRWSVRRLWGELAEIYTAETAGRSAQLPSLAIQYADYAVWQRERLQGERLRRQLDYWREQLADLPLLELPYDRRRPDMLSFRGAGERLQIAPDMVERLRGLVRQESTTLHTLLLAAYAVLLSRTSGQDDIAIGVPVAGRVRTELEPLVGFFINTLVIRARLDGNLSCRDFVRQMKQTMLAALDHQDAPFERLVTELEPERRLNRNPFVTTMFQLFELPPARFDLPFLTVEVVETPDLHAKFDMACSLETRPDGVSGHWSYATDLFDAATIQRMIGHYQTLLAGMVAHPDCPISALPLLTDAERQQIVTLWNDTAVDYPSEQSVHRLFAAQADRTPAAVALDGAGQELTYAGLDARANQLANFLHGEGVEPGQIVAICMERSPDMVIAMLAILKLGCAYLPLDPAHPADRLSRQLADSNARAVLVHRHTERLVPPDGTEVLSLDAAALAISTQSTRAPAIETDPQAPAYVIYTSGSTGRPKGVVVPHRAIARLVCNTNYVQIGADEVMAQATNVAFDVAAFEIWGALLNGARLVFVDKETLLDPTKLSAVLIRKHVTIMFVTTALFNYLVEAQPAVFSSLWVLLFGGEASSPKHVARALEAAPPQQIIHIYGPTEATVFATILLVESVDLNLPTVPIGRPIANTTAYVLDAHLEPLPVGVAGELYLGGPGLALGYLNDPQLTAEKFIPSPFTSEPGARLYRTGDLARYRSDGTLEFLGRVDRQIKIRGFRVEPGEIEAVIAQHPGVREAVVVARKDQGDEVRLAAYIVSAGDHPAIAPDDLRAFLGARLPSYMLPAAYVFMDHLPLTPNGKIDRAALPAPDVGARLDVTTPFIAPRNELEQQIADIWADLLGLDEVGVEDSFFELGGDSILTMRMVLAAEAIVGPIPPQVYSHKLTIRVLAELARSGSSATATDLGLASPGPISNPVLPPGRSIVRRLGTVSPPAALRWAAQRALFGMNYRTGMAWLRWLGQPAMARLLFRQESAWLRGLAEELNYPDPDDPVMMRANIIGNMLQSAFRESRRRHGMAQDGLAALDAAPERFWRSFAGQMAEAPAAERKRMVQFHGLEHLVHAQRKGRGVILVTYHSAVSDLADVALASVTSLGRIFTPSLFRAGLVAAQISEDEAQLFDSTTGLAAYDTVHAHRILQEGGIVRFGSDYSYDHPNSLTKQVGRRLYHLKPGFAELALLTGAAVLPAYSYCEPAGAICLTLLPALNMPDSGFSHDQQINALLDQYVAFLNQAWRSKPESMGWGALRRHHSLPQAHAKGDS